MAVVAFTTALSTLTVYAVTPVEAEAESAENERRTRCASNTLHVQAVAGCTENEAADSEEVVTFEENVSSREADDVVCTNDEPVSGANEAEGYTSDQAKEGVSCVWYLP